MDTYGKSVVSPEENFAHKILKVFKAEGFCADDGSTRIVIEEVRNLLLEYDEVKDPFRRFGVPE